MTFHFAGKRVLVTGAASAAQNIVKCANQAGLNVVDIVLEPLASAEAVLNDFRSGALGRITLETLIADGRIHPSRIEELVEQAKRDIEEKVDDVVLEQVHLVDVQNVPRILKVVNLVDKTLLLTNWIILQE